MRWDIGIDLGTRNVRMVAEGAGEAFAQSAALAAREGEEAPLAFGDAAMALYGRESAGMEVCFPLSDGTLRNGEHAEHHDGNKRQSQDFLHSSSLLSFYRNGCPL